MLYTARLPQPCTVRVQDAAPMLGASQAKVCTAAPVLSMLTSPAHDAVSRLVLHAAEVASIIVTPW